MLKQLPSRNQRSKGLKVKHTIQICVLIAIGIWLLYQVKHFCDKKVLSEESSRKISENVQGGNEILKLGRKNLNPRVEEVSEENLTDRDDEEEEEIEQADIGSKLEENEEEGKAMGDDEEPEILEDLIDEEDTDREEKGGLARDDRTSGVKGNPKGQERKITKGVML